MCQSNPYNRKILIIQTAYFKTCSNNYQHVLDKVDKPNEAQWLYKHLISLHAQNVHQVFTLLYSFDQHIFSNIQKCWFSDRHIAIACGTQKPAAS